MTPVDVEFSEISGRPLGVVRFTDDGPSGPARLVAVCRATVGRLGPEAAADAFSDWSNGYIASRKVS